MKKLLFIFAAGSAVMVFQNVHAQTLRWAKSMGGTGDDGGASIAVDASGNVYTAGNFQRTADFDPDTGTFNITEAGDGQFGETDVFISKLDTVGNFVWAKQLGGTRPDAASSIALDAVGNVYTTGSFEGVAFPLPDFDPGPGTFNLASSGGPVFISKLDAAGNFVWAKQLGGSEGNSVVDAAGNVYTVGTFTTTADFDPGAGTFNLTAAGTGGKNVFISKLDASGNFVWAKQLGASESRSIAIDDSGNVYITGLFAGTADFDPGAGIFNLNSGMFSYNVFVTKLDASGNFVWAKQLGWSAWYYYYARPSIIVDATGNVYTTGYFDGTGDFDPGPATFNLTPAGGGGLLDTDIFISKLDASGNFIWAKQLGGMASLEWGSSLAVDDSGNVYTSGTFTGPGDFDPGPGTFNLTPDTISATFTNNTFTSKLDAAGNFVWARLGGFQYIDAMGNIYATGSFKDTLDFDQGPGTFNMTSVGAFDIFVAKYSQDFSASVSISGTIISEIGLPVSVVTVTLSGDDTQTDITDAFGRYNFTVPQGSNYIVTPSKNNDVVTNNGLTSLDVLLMRKHILGIAPLPSPYKIIAAAEVNADGDTTISTQDILFTRSLILGNISAFPTNRLWQFVSSDYVFPDTQHPFPFPKTRTYTNITTNQTNQNFIGIKLGDVNGSWDGNIP